MSSSYADDEIHAQARREALFASIRQAKDEIERLRAANERLTDLVRYKRQELHLDGLISDEEYAKLAMVRGAVARLEGYDAAIAKLKGSA